MYRLVYLTGPRQGRRLTVREGDVVFGSNPACPIRIVHPAVAAQHAILEARNHGIYIRVLGQKLTVVVNQERVTGKQLAHGDEIELGNDRLLFQLSDTPRRPPERSGAAQHLTRWSIGAVLLAQLLVIGGGLLYRRFDPIRIPPPLPPVNRSELAERLRTHAWNSHYQPDQPQSPAPFKLRPLYLVVPAFTLPDDKPVPGVVNSDTGGEHRRGTNAHAIEM